MLGRRLITAGTVRDEAEAVVVLTQPLVVQRNTSPNCNAVKFVFSALLK